MNELLDNPNQPSQTSLLNWSVLIKFYFAALTLISYLFFRPLNGSDLDAILVLVGLWALCIWFIHQQSIKSYVVILVFSTIVLHYFLVFIHHIVAWLVADLMPSQWRWSHFELIKGTPDRFAYVITEIVIWSIGFCLMVMAATFSALLLEYLRNRQRH